ncbi:MAG: hypothetical protein ACN6PJ_30455 [Achromobacter sp.]|uniref:hypothetical protein n=1 Tax=Achromobacter sp. TaxID=134375 RepID=UPI003CFC170B
MFEQLLKRIKEKLFPSNIDSTAYQAGRRAWIAGEVHNPHIHGTLYYKSWALGAHDALMDEAKVY